MKLFSKKKKADSAPEKAKNVITSDSKFAIVEGYKIARTNLIFSLTAQESNAVAITSWSKGEGKSTATVNLAISFAKMGKKILLVDTDLRRPNLHNLLKVKNESGITDVIAGIAKFDDVVHRDVVSCLDVLTSGAIPPNPSELLASPGFVDLITMAKENYDYVIMDTPPLGVVADTLLLKDFVGGFVLVVRERITTHARPAEHSPCGFEGARLPQGRMRPALTRLRLQEVSLQIPLRLPLSLRLRLQVELQLLHLSVLMKKLS